MIRKVIKIDDEKCNGCGLCVTACHENAISMLNGKAVLLHDDYCDGLGNCLPTCHQGAISFEEREAGTFNEEAIKSDIKNLKADNSPIICPGTQAEMIEHKNFTITNGNNSISSKLNQWPIQIKLAPITAEYFNNADLLIAADCTAYAYRNFHNDFIKTKITLIGCPKLDNEDYTHKLTSILKNNNIKSITVIRMEVPCCEGIVNAVKDALRASACIIPWKIKIISTQGDIVD